MVEQQLIHFTNKDNFELLMFSIMSSERLLVWFDAKVDWNINKTGSITYICHPFEDDTTEPEAATILAVCIDDPECTIVRGDAVITWLEANMKTD